MTLFFDAHYDAMRRAIFSASGNYYRESCGFIPSTVTTRSGVVTGEGGLKGRMREKRIFM